MGIPHKQYYPKPGWVEHDAEEIYQNTLEAIRQLPLGNDADNVSVAITNQRETVVIWDRHTSRPIYHAVVWQCMRGQEICDKLKADGYADVVKEKSGLLIDPYFAGSGARWLLDNVEGARLSPHSLVYAVGIETVVVAYLLVCPVYGVLVRYAEDCHLCPWSFLHDNLSHHASEASIA